MNRLKTTDNGGFPLMSDDARWWSRGAEDAIAQSNTLDTTRSYIISGLALSLSGTMFTWTAGIALMNGEVVYIDADPVGIDISMLPYIYLEPVVTFDTTDPAGLKVFEDTTSHYVYEITKGTFVGHAAPSGGPYPLWYSLLTKNKLISLIVSAQNNVFTQCQSWAKGAAVTLTGSNAVLSTDGNTFGINIGAVNTLSLITGANVGEPGTIIILRFMGTSPTDYVTVDASGNIVTPDSQSYTYRSGDCIILFAIAGNNWQLVERQMHGWHTPGAITGGWTSGAFRYKMNRDGLVSFIGTLAKIGYNSTLDVVDSVPALYRPSQDIFFNIVTTNGDPGIITVFAATGNISIKINGLSGPTNETVSFSGLSYYTD